MTDYTLTRRDAVAALTAAGVAVGSLGALTWTSSEDREDEQSPIEPRQRETLIAVAETVYPSEVTGIPAFLETFLGGRIEDRPEHARGVGRAATTLDEYALEREDAHYAELPVGRRDDLLRELGVDVVDPDPAGIDPARLRYYLVNELLFALYSSPTGGELVGIENPQGYPGGTTSYRRGPRG